TRSVARELGRRLAACGINLNWAPSADVNSNPDNPVIGVRSFGDDPELVARHTAAYVEGLQQAGVAACTKHFPGHGDTAVDSHHGLPRIDADLTTLYARELVPFRAALAAGADAICVGGGLADEGTVLRLRDALVRAVREGELPEERLAQAAARVRALGVWARDAARGAQGAQGAQAPGAEDSGAPGPDS